MVARLFSGRRVVRSTVIKTYFKTTSGVIEAPYATAASAARRRMLSLWIDEVGGAAARSNAVPPDHEATW